MEKIELEPLDKKDLLEILEYAKQKYKEDKPIDKRDHWDNSKWWDIRIEQLKMLIKGYVPHTSYIQSSYTTIQKQPTTEEKRKLKQNTITSEIIDLLDYINEKKDSKDLF